MRLVSMFLNYSALESGKLVLQLRENDLRDCLDELAKRWSEAFQRKGVQAGSELRSIDSNVPLRLSESAAGGCESFGQCAEAHAQRAGR